MAEPVVAHRKQPRSGPRGRPYGTPLAWGGRQGQGQWGQGQGQGHFGLAPFGMAFGMAPQQHRQHPEGSWTCPSNPDGTPCGNVNWPQRTHCNVKSCALPKPAHLGPPPAQARSLWASGGGGGGGIQHPEGSWTCPSNPDGTPCGNVNWPQRTHCNVKSCALPKPGTEHEVGYDPQPRGGGGGGGIQHPEGSWTCATYPDGLYCGNVNWPQRTVCNKQECRMPRPTEEELQQQQAQQQQQQAQQQQQQQQQQMQVRREGAREGGRGPGGEGRTKIADKSQPIKPHQPH